MRKGDVALFNAYTPHRGTLNTTFEGPNAVRWSLDLRYQKAGTPTGRPHWPAFVVQSADAAREQRGFESGERAGRRLVKPQCRLHTYTS